MNTKQRKSARRVTSYPQLGIELLECRYALDAAVGSFIRISGDSVVNSYAEAGVLSDARQDAPLMQVQESLAHNSATASVGDETGFAFGHSDGTAYTPTPIGIGTAVPQTTADSIGQAHANGFGGSGASTGSDTDDQRFQYVADPDFPTNLVFHGHLFVGGAAGVIASPIDENGGEAGIHAQAHIGEATLLIDGKVGTGILGDVALSGNNIPGYADFLLLFGGNPVAVAKHIHFTVPIINAAVIDFGANTGSGATVFAAGGFAQGQSSNNAIAWGYVTGEGQDLPDGDFNGDGLVDGGDFDIWEDGAPQADADEDGDVDDADLLIWAQNTDELVVSTESDGIDGNYTWGNLSLREAIALAADANHPGADEIFFAPYVEEILLTNSQLLIGNGNNVVIRGLGADRLTVNAQGNSRVFYVLNTTSVTDVTIQGMRITGGSSAGGGGIYSNGKLTLEGVQIDGNTSSAQGGGIYHVGSSIRPLTIRDSTIAGNLSTGSGTSRTGGGIFVNAPATIINTTISGNTASSGAGGVHFASTGGQMINCTVMQNVGSYGGVRAQSVSLGQPGTAALLKNTIVAGAAGPGVYDITGTFNTASANNLIGKDPTLNNGIDNGVNNNQVGAQGGLPIINPMLGSLANNGGPTTSHAPLDGSPAIDKGENAFVANLQYDQRGKGFWRIFDGGLGDLVDIGAIEFDFASAQGGGSLAVLSSEAYYSIETSNVESRENGISAIAFSDPVVQKTRDIDRSALYDRVFDTTQSNGNSLLVLMKRANLKTAMQSSDVPSESGEVIDSDARDEFFLECDTFLENLMA